MSGRLTRRSAKIKGGIVPYEGQKELKYVDTTLSTKLFDTTGSVSCLNLIAVGNDVSTRDGREVTIESVQLLGLIEPVDSATLNHLARYMLVWDNAVNSGSIATMTDILTAARSTGYPNLNNRDRFTILYDAKIALGALAAQFQGLCFHKIDVSERVNAVTKYSGTTAAIGSIQNGGLLFVTIGDVAAGFGSEGTIYARVRFTDN